MAKYNESNYVYKLNYKYTCMKVVEMKPVRSAA
jgi:hypothetical protein